MISIPVHSKLAKMPLRERFSWALSNVWGVGFALFTIWFYVPRQPLAIATLAA